MAEKAKRKKGMWRSLNVMLWLAFSLFAAAIIIASVLLQNTLASRRYRDETARTLKAAGEQVRELEGDGVTADEIASVAYENRLDAYLIFEEERTVVACAGGERTYSELSWVGNSMQNGETSVLTLEGEYGYAITVASGGGTAYLYFASSFAHAEQMTGGLRWASLITVLFALVLAFAVSGLFALFLSKPVTEVTERAKSLARGNYAPAAPKKYFFSEIEELSEALEYARSEISVADSLQKELIANVSHDFKTPLTMIKAYASMIKDISGEDKEKREAHAQVIIDETDRLAALVADLLDLSRLRAGVVGETTVFNLSDAVYAIVGRFDYLRETHGYLLESDIAEEVYCKAERARIEQVVYNLISNAVNYTGEDKRVRVKLFRTETGSRLEVIDSGKGIPQEEIGTIWDRYYRSTGTHKRPVQGTGLGLSIVKSILLAQNFPFGVVSEVGKGSCFWVEFPSPDQDKEEA